MTNLLVPVMDRHVSIVQWFVSSGRKDILSLNIGLHEFCKQSAIYYFIDRGALSYSDKFIFGTNSPLPINSIASRPPKVEKRHSPRPLEMLCRWSKAPLDWIAGFLWNADQGAECYVCTFMSLGDYFLSPSHDYYAARYDNQNDRCNSQCCRISGKFVRVVGETGREINQSPIHRRFFVALFSVVISFGLIFRGGQHFYYDRRFLGATFITGGLLLSSLGIGLLYATSIRSTWNWLL